MFVVVLENSKTKEWFEKKFESPCLLQKFVNKCKRSKKVKLIGVYKK